MTHSRPETVTVSLDVHKNSVRLAAARRDELVAEQTLPYDHAAIWRAISRWPGARVCYEAGPTGFGLYRQLKERGVDCEVVAPGLVPSRPGDRVKTDRRDARKLAYLHASGLLEPIWVPSPELEAVRDLIRAREDGRIDRMRDRHRLSKFLLRHDRPLPGGSWGPTRRGWIAAQRFEHSAQQRTLDTYLHAVDLVDARIAALEEEIRRAAAAGPWAEAVADLRCLRGVETLTALGLVAEVGEFGRFGTAMEFMGFTGLCPSERSSGDERRQGSITKAGNEHVRRLLVEAAWHARLAPRVGKALERRQRGRDPLVIERAWRCQLRLNRRWRRMAARGKPHQKIVVACARELAGFVWAIATNQPLRAD
jgi:transposase